MVFYPKFEPWTEVLKEEKMSAASAYLHICQCFKGQSCLKSSMGNMQYYIDLIKGILTNLKQKYYDISEKGHPLVIECPISL